jgi:DNA polymerase-1
MSKKLFLIDGNAFCYRAFFAVRALTTSQGEPTNAVFGFLSILKKIIADEKPDYLAVCFDSRGPTFRHKKFEDYKAHRPDMPQELVVQMPVIRELIEAYRIPTFAQEGFEADDILGTLAKKFASKECTVYIATSDKDALQLVNSHVLIYNSYREDTRIYDADNVRQRFSGIGPEHITDLLALWGDASDNIPGVHGIGEKTAIELISQYKTLEGVYKNLDKIKKPAQKKSLEENKKLAFLSRELATIDCDMPLKVTLKELELKTPDEAKLKTLFQRLEFRTFLKDIEPEAKVERKKEHRSYQAIATESAFEVWLKQFKKQTAWSFDTETTSEDPLRAELVGMSFSWEDKTAFYIPVTNGKHQGPGLKTEWVLKHLKPLLEDATIKKYGQNIKYDFLVIDRQGVHMKGIAFDTMVASYLINPIKPNHNLDDIAFEHLGLTKIPTRELLGSGRNQRTMDLVPLEQIQEYACEDADVVWRLVPLLSKKLESHHLNSLFSDMELPLIEVLAQIEKNGVKIDAAYLKTLSKKAEHELDRLSKAIYKEAGEEFNINSPKQLGTILFEKLKLPTKKKTKTGFSTDVNVLTQLAETYTLPQLLLEFREQSKLKSTYLDALPLLIHPETGCVHTSFNQTVTSTGRLSSSNPNLQNIPIKTETGRAIRKAFIPRGSKRKIVSADYSQIELRLLAHLADDPALTEAFKEDRDVHVHTACILYGCKEKEVTHDMRQAAKTVNFSIIYGKTAFGLSRDLKISQSEAAKFIESYFNRYSRVKKYLDDSLKKAKKDGYTMTALGRRCYFPEINSSNIMMRQFAERAAVNAPIQGSAADLIKLAMIALHKELSAHFEDVYMILQVHDELVFDVPDALVKKVEKTVKEKMENVMKLHVPLRVDLHTGETWFKE